MNRGSVDPRMREFVPVITRRLEWDSAHRVLRHESKCASLHGHRYVALVKVTASELDDCDRVVDFGVVKERVGGWIDDNWDHTTLVNSQDKNLLRFCLDEHHHLDKRAPYVLKDAEPTAEVIATELRIIAQGLLADAGVRVVSVEVFETPNCSAESYPPDIRRPEGQTQTEPDPEERPLGAVVRP